MKYPGVFDYAGKYENKINSLAFASDALLHVYNPNLIKIYECPVDPKNTVKVI